MRKIFLGLVVVGLFACEKTQQENVETNEVEKEVEVTYASFGEEINAEGAITAEELSKKMESVDSIENVKVVGVIDEVCQVKGCWMDVKIGEDDFFKVNFKDYGFFMPKDAAGKEVIIEGKAIIDTISVERLRHWERDAGTPEEEVMQITEPQIDINFTANGVLIKDSEEESAK